MSTLKAKAEAILQEKEVKILPENIKKDVVAFGVTGELEELDTSDANALNADILYSKSAYVDGSKIIGTMPNNGALSYTPSTIQQSIPSGYTSGGIIDAVTSSIDANITAGNIKSGTTILGVTGNLVELKGETKSVTPTTSQQVIVPTGTGKNALTQVTVGAVTNSIDANISANNIKSGVSILGVTGNVVALNGETKSITPTTSQQTFTPTSPNNGFTSVTVNGVTSSIDANIVAGNIKKNVSILGVTGTYEGSGGGGSSNLKMFSTVAEMNSSSGNQDGDIAIVYKNDIQNFSASTVTRKIIFPDSVTQPTQIEEEMPPLLVATTDYSIMYAANLTLTPTSFEYYSSDNEIVTYTSSDGIHYTKTSGVSKIELGFDIAPDSSIPWFDEFGYFLLTGSYTFSGLYTYDGANSQWVVPDTQLSAVPSSVYNSIFTGKNGVQSGTLGNSANNTFTDINAEVYGHLQSYYDTLTPIVIDGSEYTDTEIRCVPMKSNGTPLWDTSNLTSMHELFAHCTYLVTIPVLDTTNVTDTTLMFEGCVNLKYVPLLDTSNVTDLYSMFYGCSSLESVPLFDTSSATSMSSLFYNCKSLTSVPAFDFTSCDSMYQMFYGCSSLTSIPLYDTKNVTNMYHLCDGCSSLTTAPSWDTRSVTNFSYVFANCTNLETVPVYRTDAMVSMSYTFQKCPNLSNASLNNILQMCANTTSAYTGTKNLRNLGLTSAQATTCTTLSNWSAAQSSGWSKGY